MCGGPERVITAGPGWYAAPTLLTEVEPQMTVAREEVFGPVLCVMPYDSVEQAVGLANDSAYGLSGMVWGEDEQAAADVARRLRTGSVHLNGAPADLAAPFGGYGQSGNGREWGRFGLEEFLEVKALIHAATE